MKSTFTIKIVHLLLAVCLSGATAIAQQVDRSTKKARTGSIFQKSKIHLTAKLPSLMAKATDNGISEWVDQYYDGNNWIDEYKAVFSYSSDRLTISITDYYKESDTWEETGSAEFVFNSDGFPLSAQSSYLYEGMIEDYEELFYYSDNGRIDSATFSYSYGEETEFEKIVFEYITADSIHITYFEEDSIDEEGYFVNRNGNFIEVYEGDEYLERYTNYDVTFNDFLKNLYNDFYFYDVLNEEYDSEAEAWIPYYRIMYSEEGGRVTQMLEDWYDTENEEWMSEYRQDYTYENSRITEIAESYYDFSSEDWVSNYRSLISYGTSVSNEENVESITEFRLNQNYPNPFNPTTKISFTIPQTGNVQVSVFNVLGRQVSEILNEIKPAGEYTLTFNAQDLPSGIYYYKLTAPGFSEIKSMTLIK